MKEEFLHYAWRMRRFDASQLKTTTGQSLTIIQAGNHNHDGGPDFLNGRVRIGETEWAGTIEMHLKASDWEKHQHSSDPAYENVILHVVYEEDKTIFRNNGERIPCLEIGSLIPHKLLSSYQRLMVNEHWIPCQPFLPGVDTKRSFTWLERLAIERLETHYFTLTEHLQQHNNDWTAVFYRRLLRYFGGRVNNEACEQLAISIPWSILEKHKDEPNHLYAILYGQSGLLDGQQEDAFPKALWKEYRFFATKYGLEPLHKGIWKFLRMRPANFPTVRLAQFAATWLDNQHLMRQVLEADTLKELEPLFRKPIHDYWDDHYQFDRPSETRTKQLGRATFHTIAINALVPFIFTYGKFHGDQKLQDKALAWLSELPSEKNSIIDRWKGLGQHPQHAMDSQALLFLKKNYCDRKRCLECALGHLVLKR